MNTILLISLIVVIAFIGLTIYNYRRIKKMPIGPENPKIKHLTANTFNQHIKGGISIVDFWAEWCMPCKLMTPILNDLAEHSTFKIYKVNVDQQQALAAKYRIKSIPTLVIFKNGKEIKRIIGVKTKDYILKEIEKI